MTQPFQPDSPDQRSDGDVYAPPATPSSPYVPPGNAYAAPGQYGPGQYGPPPGQYPPPQYAAGQYPALGQYPMPGQYPGDLSATPPRRSRWLPWLIAVATVAVLVVAGVLIGLSHRSSARSKTLVDQADHVKLVVPHSWSEISDPQERQRIMRAGASALPSDLAAQAAAASQVVKLFATDGGGGRPTSTLNLVVYGHGKVGPADQVADIKADVANGLSRAGVTVTADVVTKYAGQPAVRIDYHGRIGSIPFDQKGIQVYLFHDAQVYIVTVNTSDPDKIKAELEGVLSSLAFTD